jgi:hypothetical protein
MLTSLNIRPMTAIGWKSCLLWTAHTPCGVNSLRKSNQIKSNLFEPVTRGSADMLMRDTLRLDSFGCECEHNV